MQFSGPTNHHGYYGEGYGRYTYLPRYVYCPYPPPYERFLPKHRAASRRMRRSQSNSPSSGHDHSSGSGQDEPERGIDAALVGGAKEAVHAPIAMADLATAPVTTYVTPHEPAAMAGNTTKRAHDEEDDVPLSQLFRAGFTKECPGA